MKNTMEIKRENGLNYILPAKSVLSERSRDNRDVLVVIYLYYEDLLEKYLENVYNVPNDIHILFITSREEVRNRIENCMRLSHKSYEVVMKPNRGRDVSGLLVAARERILNYKYVCFVHDKREKNENERLDAQHFSDCMWKNLLGSSACIENIIQTLESDETLGILLPPEPLSPNFSYMISDTWGVNFEIAQRIAKQIGLSCDIRRGEKPLSVGTSFWARTEALEKLFSYEWKYEDFNDEPLPNDGTISHAIERILSYIAMDAGYKSGIVMTDQFAGERLAYVQDVMTDAFSLMRSNWGIYSIARLYETNDMISDWKITFKEYENIYIYGAGFWGRRCKNVLALAGREVTAFLVSKKEVCEIELDGKPILEVHKADLGVSDFVIIAASIQTSKEIEKELKEVYPEFENICYFNA